MTSLVADNMTRTRHRSDRELIGRGIGHRVTGSFGAVQGACATLRTVVNIQNGGRTNLSGMTHSIVLPAIVAASRGRRPTRLHQRRSRPGKVEVGVEGDADVIEVQAGQGVNILGGSRVTSPREYAWTRKLNWNMDPSAGGIVDRTDLSKAYDDILDQDYD